jgi:hypothetical protein
MEPRQGVARPRLEKLELERAGGGHRGSVPLDQRGSGGASHPLSQDNATRGPYDYDDGWGQADKLWSPTQHIEAYGFQNDFWDASEDSSSCSSSSGHSPGYASPQPSDDISGPPSYGDVTFGWGASDDRSPPRNIDDSGRSRGHSDDAGLSSGESSVSPLEANLCWEGSDGSDSEASALGTPSVARDGELYLPPQHSDSDSDSESGALSDASTTVDDWGRIGSLSSGCAGSQLGPTAPDDSLGPFVALARRMHFTEAEALIHADHHGFPRRPVSNTAAWALYVEPDKLGRRPNGSDRWRNR